MYQRVKEFGNTLIKDTVLIRDQVVEIILNRIFSGELKNNERLSERQLSCALDVSTTPVKEAFRILEIEGFLYTVPRKGTFVSECPEDIADQVIHMRSSLEGVAAYYAAKHITEADKSVITDLLERSRVILEEEKNGSLREGAKESALAELFDINVSFHVMIRRASGNGYLTHMTAILQSMERMFRKRTLWLNYDERYKAYSEHVGIYRAVLEGDCDLAAELARNHLLRSGNLLTGKK